LKLESFEIGIEFWCGCKKWQCTDVGTRVIVAICITDHIDDPSWLNGPPYAITEVLFDEYDQEGCDIKSES